MNAKGAGICTLDQPAWAGHEVEIPNTGTLGVVGWAFGEIGQPLPNVVFLELYSTRTMQTEIIEARRALREDVARHFGDPGLSLSGFTAGIQLGAPRFGSYAVHLVQRGPSGTYRLENVLQFSVLSETYESSARAGLARKFLRGNGIEIGALQRRVALPPGCAVSYVDRMSLSELRLHYPELNGMPLQAPDIVDDGEKLAYFMDSSLDFVIANHFLEHCENPILALHNFLRVLRPNGILYMAVPDKRTTFDAMRPCTEWGVLKETFCSSSRADRAALYREWAQLVMKYAGPQVEQVAAHLLQQAYSIHFNVWDLTTLLDFLWRVKFEIGLPLTPVSVVSSENETILILMAT